MFPFWDEQANGHAFDPDDEDSEFNYMLDDLEVRDDTTMSEIDQYSVLV